MIVRSVTIAAALAAARRQLADSPTAALDSRLLMEAATGLDHAGLIGAGREPLQEGAAHRFAGLLARRSSGEPMAYILGRQEFYGRDFRTAPGVLIPRPETEMLVDAALELEPKPRSILDLGTGSGCLLLTALAELDGARGLGIDICDDALAIAAANRAALGLDERAKLRRLGFSDAASALAPTHFDLVLANPPYIREGTELPRSVAAFEPAAALFAGADGLDAHRQVARVIASRLAPGGSAFVEIGHDQGQSASEVYAEALAHRSVGTHRDAAGQARMVAVGPERCL